jgi:flagellum-specific ATP synthase
MADVIDPDHARAAATFRRLWSAYEQNADLVMMGAYAAGSDATLDEAIARRGEMLGFVSQNAKESVDWQRSWNELVEGFGQ